MFVVKDFLRAAASQTCAVLWYLVCFFSTIDTGLFVYPSLSQTLLGGFCLVVLFMWGTCYGLSQKAGISINGVCILVFFWCIYLLFHSILIAEAEDYKLTYLLVSLLFLLAMRQMLQNGSLTFQQLENGILFMLVCQLTGLLLQAAGLMSSYSTFFPLTGFNENPNVTAITIAVCIPIVFDRLKTSEHPYFFMMLFIVSVIFFFILGCRTAYIGLAIIIVVRISFSDKIQGGVCRINKKKVWYMGTFLLLLLVLVAIALYKIKEDSSDGRLLIWKISTEMLTSHPQGWGIGMFEHHYNLCQSEYFSKGVSTKTEEMLAGVVYMAYNDYLEHGVEAGIVGMLFLSLFYIALAFKAYKERKIVALSIICAAIAMSLVNFIYAAIQPWLILLCYSSYVMNSEGKDIVVRKGLSTGSHIATLVICILLMRTYTEKILAQMSLKQYEGKYTREEVIKVEEVETLSNHIGTSEAYWRFLGKLYYRIGDYKKALNNNQKASCYSADPSVFFSIFDCYDKIGETEKGLGYLYLVKNMIPQNLTSRMLLMQWYDHCGQKEKACDMAHEISEIPVKVRTKKSDAIQNFARRYLIKQQKQ